MDEDVFNIVGTVANTDAGTSKVNTSTGNKDPSNLPNKEFLNSPRKNRPSKPSKVHSNHLRKDPSNISRSRVKATPPMSRPSTNTSHSSSANKKLKQQLIGEKKAEQLRIMKDGLVVLHLNMSELFQRGRCARDKMAEAVQDVMGFEVGMYLTTPLMPNHMVRELKPLTVTVNRVTGLPSTPISHEQLRQQ